MEVWKYGSEVGECFAAARHTQRERETEICIRDDGHRNTHRTPLRGEGRQLVRNSLHLKMPPTFLTFQSPSGCILVSFVSWYLHLLSFFPDFFSAALLG
jgi:hypothetical protein